MKNVKQFIAIVFVAIGLAACATAGDPPNQLFFEAQSDIKAAKEAGASEYAPVILRTAENQLQEADAAIKKEKYEDARLLLEKSLANSRLAAAKTHATKSEAAATAVDKGIHTLNHVLQEE